MVEYSQFSSSGVLSKDGLIGTLKLLSEVPSAGPSPAFSFPHVCAALLMIGDARVVGRIQLSKKLGLGEGVVRTILRHLTAAGMIRTTTQGCQLTPRGIALYKRIRNKIVGAESVDAKQLGLDKVNEAVLVRSAGNRVKQGVEQRDAAIKIGATGACTLLMKRGRFVMPMGTEDWTLGIDDPLTVELTKLFNLKENDVVIIASAREKTLADYGAVAAALTLLE